MVKRKHLLKNQYGKFLDINRVFWLAKNLLSAKRLQPESVSGWLKSVGRPLLVWDASLSRADRSATSKYRCLLSNLNAFELLSRYFDVIRRDRSAQRRCISNKPFLHLHLHSAKWFTSRTHFWLFKKSGGHYPRQVWFLRRHIWYLSAIRDILVGYSNEI